MSRAVLASLLVASLAGCTRHHGKHQDAPGSCPPTAPHAGKGGPVDRMRATIFGGLRLAPGMRLADIGTGQGWFLTRAAREMGPKGRAYGTDIDQHTVDVVRAYPKLAIASPIEVRLARRPYDTALDDLPADDLDEILMIDSLCFDHRVSRKIEVAYLHRFLRLLKPGGRLVHHMDCTCGTTIADVEALFAEAGFSKRVGRIPVPCADVDTSLCRSAHQQALGRFVGVFVKPGPGG